VNEDAFGPGDDQAKTLRILVSSSRKTRVSEIIREIEAHQADQDRRQTPVISAFLTRRGSEMPKVWKMPHRLVVVVGGRPGVGATTIARNVAAELANRGIRAEYVGHEVARTIGSQGADYYLLDSEGSADFEGLADHLVLVTAPDAGAVTGAYAALKRFRTSDPGLPAGLVVNRISSPGEGAALAERMASAARAFLGGPELEILGWVLADNEVSSGARDAAPFIVRAPRSAAAAGVRLCVRRLSARWRRGRSASAA
jgi:MinD-like ATPase involved in chromosome partitioning or flagellar assembly